MKHQIIAGDQYIEANLPEGVRIINPPTPLPNIADIEEKLDGFEEDSYFVEGDKNYGNKRWW